MKVVACTPAAELPRVTDAPKKPAVVLPERWAALARFISPAAKLPCSVKRIPAFHTCSLVQSGRPARKGRSAGLLTPRILLSCL